MKKLLLRNLPIVLLLSASTSHATLDFNTMSSEERVALKNIKKSWKNFPFKYVVDAESANVGLTREQLMPFAWHALEEAENYYSDQPQTRSNYTLGKAKLLFDPLFDPATSGLNNINRTIYNCLFEMVNAGDEINGRNIHHARIWLACLRYKRNFMLENETMEDSMDKAWGFLEDAIRSNTQGRWTRSPILWQAEMISRKKYAPLVDGQRLSRVNALEMAEEKLSKTYGHSASRMTSESVAIRNLRAVIATSTQQALEEDKIGQPQEKENLPQLISNPTAKHELPATASITELKQLHRDLSQEVASELKALAPMMSLPTTIGDHSENPLAENPSNQSDYFPSSLSDSDDNTPNTPPMDQLQTVPFHSGGTMVDETPNSNIERPESLTTKEKTPSSHALLENNPDNSTQGHSSNGKKISSLDQLRDPARVTAEQLLLAGTSQADVVRATGLTRKIVHNISVSLNLTAKKKKVEVERNNIIDQQACEMLRNGSSHKEIMEKIGLTQRQVSRISQAYNVRKYKKPNARITPGQEKELHEHLKNNDRQFSEVASELGLTPHQVSKFARKHNYTSPRLKDDETKKNIARDISKKTTTHKEIAETRGVTKGYVDQTSYKMNRDKKLKA